MSDNAAERELGLTVARALNERRSCRAFQPSRPVSDALLNELLTLAARAPSGGNTQPWRVYALRGTALEQLTTATSAAVRSGQLSEDGKSVCLSRSSYSHCTRFVIIYHSNCTRITRGPISNVSTSRCVCGVHVATASGCARLVPNNGHSKRRQSCSCQRIAA